MTISFETLRALLLGDPRVKAEYDALAPECGLVEGGCVRGALATAVAEAKREARASGLTDEEIDAELDAWRVGR
jgi:hypothetical protein